MANLEKLAKRYEAEIPELRAEIAALRSRIDALEAREAPKPRRKPRGGDK